MHCDSVYWFFLCLCENVKFTCLQTLRSSWNHVIPTGVESGQMSTFLCINSHSKQHYWSGDWDGFVFVFAFFFLYVCLFVFDYPK